MVSIPYSMSLAAAAETTLWASPALHFYPPAGHYADAGEVAVLMSSSLDVHMVMTGHGLGRNKLEHLLASGGLGWALRWALHSAI